MRVSLELGTNASHLSLMEELDVSDSFQEKLKIVQKKKIFRCSNHHKKILFGKKVLYLFKYFNHETLRILQSILDLNDLTKIRILT